VVVPFKGFHLDESLRGWLIKPKSI
jgi:hypothetical protein